MKLLKQEKFCAFKLFMKIRCKVFIAMHVCIAPICKE